MYPPPLHDFTMNNLRRGLLASLLASYALPAAAQTAYPMLMHLSPVAAQVGQTSEHELNSRYDLRGTYLVLVTGEGVTGEVVPPPDEKQDVEKDEAKQDKPPKALTRLKLRFTVAPDALPGVRDFRVVTPRGASTLGQLVIVADPVVSEKGDNNTLEKAQPIDVPSTVCGAIEKAEDVDVFKFTGQQGDNLSFHVRCMRLQDKIHDLQQHADPIITLRNAAGVTLASIDNHFAGDPLLAHTLPNDGDYYLEIRDVRYQGNGNWQYSIEISNRPFVSHVYPLSVQPGEPHDMQPVGHHLPGEMDTLPMTLPAETQPGVQAVALGQPQDGLNPTLIYVSDVPVVQETGQPNDDVAAGQKFTAPACISGRLETPADVDYFTFTAKKGARFRFETVANRADALVDTHLRLLDASGKQLALSDDLRVGQRNFTDSLIENWQAPADGDYVLEVRDLHLRGGDEFVYALRVTASEPTFELYADTDKTQLGPGLGSVIFCRAARKNGFKGEIQLHIEGLPPGVTAHCGRIPAGKPEDGCIVLEAAADAKMAASNVKIYGTAVLEAEAAEGEEPAAEPREIRVPAIIYQETYQPGGGRGHWPVEMHTVAVCEPLDLAAVHIEPAELTLKPGESQKITVKIERAEGFDKNVSLDLGMRHLNRTYGDTLPEGVTIDNKNSKTVINGKELEAHITLKADDKAVPIEKRQAAVLAHISLNFVMKTTYSSRPLLITVAATEEKE